MTLQLFATLGLFPPTHLSVVHVCLIVNIFLYFTALLTLLVQPIQATFAKLPFCHGSENWSGCLKRFIYLKQKPTEKPSWWHLHTRRWKKAYTTIWKWQRLATGCAWLQRLNYLIDKGKMGSYNHNWIFWSARNSRIILS